MSHRLLPAHASLAAAVALACALAGCAGASPSKPEPAAISIAPASKTAQPATSESATAETAVEPLPLPPLPSMPAAIEPPAPLACTLLGADWRSRRPLELRFRQGGPSFASVSSGEVALHVGVGPAPAGSVLDVRADGLALRAAVVPSAIDVHPAAAFVLGGFVVPLERAILDFVEGHPGELTVGFELADDVKPVSPLRARRACPELTLVRSSFDAYAAIFGKPSSDKTGRSAKLRTGTRIALSTDARSTAVAHIVVPAGYDAVVDVVETSGNKTRIVWPRTSELVFGWVPSTDLIPTAGVGFGTGSGSGSTKSGPPRAEAFVCSMDLPLVVALGSERAQVGTILAGTFIYRTAATDPFATIGLATKSLSFSLDAKLQVPAARLAACKKRS